MEKRRKIESQAINDDHPAASYHIIFGDVFILPVIGGKAAFSAGELVSRERNNSLAVNH